MQEKLKTIALIVLTFISIPFSGKAVSIVNNNTAEEIEDNKIQMLKASVNDSNLTINQLEKSQFFDFVRDSTNQNNTAYWLKIIIEVSDAEGAYVIGTNKYDILKLVKNDTSAIAAYSGNYFPNKERNLILGTNSYLKTNLKKGPNTLYLFIYNDQREEYQYAPLPLSIYSFEKFTQLQQNNYSFLYFFLGAIIIMTLYNLALYFIVRKTFYLLYILNNIAILLFVCTQTGIIELSLFKSFAYHELILTIAGNIAFIFYMLFTKSILNFKKWDPKWDKRVKIGLIGWALLNILVFINMTAGVILGSFGALFGYIIVIISSIKAVKAGSVPAKYFLIGNICYYIAIFLSILQFNQIIPSYLWNLNSMHIVQLGTMIQLALFSLSLGSTINYMRDKLLRKEREQQRQKEESQKKYSELIETKNLELELKVAERTKELIESTKIIEKKNKDIIKSLSYARRIQNALLPNQELWKSALPNSFILYKAKDIISGDFYWLNGSAQGETLFFAACDCTGHGVPGAMVSVVGYNNLNRCINEFKLLKPSDILNRLNLLVEESFEMGGKSKGEINDGMDIALCSINYIEQKDPTSPKVRLQYSGANNPLWIIRKDQCRVIASENVNTFSFNGYCLIEVIPNKQPIGRFRDRLPFNNHEFELFENDQIYIFSDGYADQFGGPKGKKFKQKQLKELLMSIQHLDMDEQKERLYHRFNEWRGNEEQVDDICVIGIRI
jgi:serine phosphatase RsbU (regulator of sigma subunit)